jgi:hypothetical protein
MKETTHFFFTSYRHKDTFRRTWIAIGRVIKAAVDQPKSDGVLFGKGVVFSSFFSLLIEVKGVRLKKKVSEGKRKGGNNHQSSERKSFLSFSRKRDNTLLVISCCKQKPPH